MGDKPGVVGRVMLCRLWLSAKVFGLHSYCGLNEGQEAGGIVGFEQRSRMPVYAV